MKVRVLHLADGHLKPLLDVSEVSRIKSGITKWYLLGWDRASKVPIRVASDVCMLYSMHFTFQLTGHFTFLEGWHRGRSRVPCPPRRLDILEPSGAQLMDRAACRKSQHGGLDLRAAFP